MYFYDESDIYFREPHGPVETPGAVRFRLKILRGTASGAKMCLRKDGEGNRDIPMNCAEAAAAYDVYECTANFDAPGLYWYHFRVDAPNGASCDVREPDGREFQVTAYAPSETTPDWMQGGITYHIFVDRFCRSGKLGVRPGSIFREDWGGCPQYLPDDKGIVHNDDFFGGDLYGVIEKLPYLEQLGITCIYLSPVFDAMSNHKYDTGDFMKIDPAFGGDEAFEQLCAEAAKRGMRVILDGVFNHVGADSVYFNKYGRYESLGAYQSEKSQWYEWFTFRKNGKYEAWWGIELLPALKKENPGYRDFICGKDGVIAHWTKKGVSGWRLDVVDELPDVFLDPLCEAMKREKSDAIIIGEVWEDASSKISYGVRRRYFLGGQLDSVMNYPLRDAIIAYVRNNDVARLADTVERQCRNYPEHVLHSLMNGLGSHDTERILTALSGAPKPPDGKSMEFFRLDEPTLATAKKRLKLASILQFTLPGAPCVFYGDETGMEGWTDPHNRRCYPWGNEDQDLLAWYVTLSKLRKSHPCFKNGKYTLVQAHDGVFAFTRGQAPNQILIAVNNSDQDKTFPSFGGVPPTAAGWLPRSDAANGSEPYSPHSETPRSDAANGSEPHSPHSETPRSDAANGSEPHSPHSEYHATTYYDLLNDSYTDSLTVKAGEPAVFAIRERKPV